MGRESAYLRLRGGMGKAENGKSRTATKTRLASASVALEGVDPQTLLRLAVPGPRGFWARSGRWFAHMGATASLEVSDPAAGDKRFREIWRRATGLLAGALEDASSEVPPQPARFFGGFAFRNGHEPRDAWEGFPTARFVLPELELQGGGEGGILTCRGLLEQGEGFEKGMEELRDRARGIRDTLRSVDLSPSSGDPWVPATRVETGVERWRDTVDRALGELKRGEVAKVVLARVQSLDAEGGLDPVDVVLNLLQDNPGAHVFFIEPHLGKVLLGAAPETVATVADGHFRATAVAGSVARGRDPREQRALAAGLLKSDKDRREHDLCVQDMVARLAPLSRTVEAPKEPHVLTLATIQHLETPIEARLNPGETVLSVLEALHPTPAVCGLPRDLALEFLEREEPFHRGWYAGPVGWFDGGGNGVFVPALRSAVGQGSNWRLFAGAGIVAGSDPNQEWDETRIKFKPVLRALARARVGDSREAEAVEGVKGR